MRGIMFWAFYIVCMTTRIVDLETQDCHINHNSKIDGMPRKNKKPSYSSYRDFSRKLSKVLSINGFRSQESPREDTKDGVKQLTERLQVMTAFLGMLDDKSDGNAEQNNSPEEMTGDTASAKENPEIVQSEENASIEETIKPSGDIKETENTEVRSELKIKHYDSDEELEECESFHAETGEVDSELSQSESSQFETEEEESEACSVEKHTFADEGVLKDQLEVLQDKKEGDSLKLETKREKENNQ